jgi:hypothetical protein
VPVCEVAATVARGKDGLAAFRVAFEHDYLSAVLSRSDGGYNASGPTADYADVCVLRNAYTYRSVQAASLSLRTGFGSSARRHLKPLSMNHMKQRTNVQMKPRAGSGASLIARMPIVWRLAPSKVPLLAATRRRSPRRPRRRSRGSARASRR